MKKKTSKIRLHTDPELKNEVQKIEKGAMTFAVVVTILVSIAAGIIVFFV